MSITPKNWATFQHYKDRKPAWIKLHHALLDDYQFACLPVASRALAPCLWLLASEYEGGEITASIEEISFRLRMSKDDLCNALGPLVEAKFFLITNGVAVGYQPASELLAETEQSAIPERETQVTSKIEKEPLSETSSDASKPKRTEYPEDFSAFWSDYPTDPLMSKKKTYDVWKRMPLEDRAKAHSAIPGFVAHCKKNPTYRPVHAVRFLMERRYDGFAPSQPSEIDWEAEIEKFKASVVRGMPHWPFRRLGPEPGYSGCRVPADILEKHGYGKKTEAA